MCCFCVSKVLLTAFHCMGTGSGCHRLTAKPGQPRACQTDSRQTNSNAKLSSPARAPQAPSRRPTPGTHLIYTLWPCPCLTGSSKKGKCKGLMRYYTPCFAAPFETGCSIENPSQRLRSPAEDNSQNIQHTTSPTNKNMRLFLWILPRTPPRVELENQNPPTAIPQEEAPASLWARWTLHAHTIHLFPHSSAFSHTFHPVHSSFCMLLLQTTMVHARFSELSIVVVLSPILVQSAMLGG